MSRTNINPLDTLKETLLNTYTLTDVISNYTRLDNSGKGLCPFHDENSSSFVVNENKNIYKCFGCDEGGNSIFSFIMKKENLSYEQALYFIQNNLKPTEETVRIKKQQEEVIIDFVDMPYTDEHLKYWELLEMEETFLHSKNVFAVKDWAMGSKYYKKTIPKTTNEITFAYYAEDIDKVKILRIGPEISKADKWRNTVPNNHLWYTNTVTDACQQLFIVKSVKDALVLQKTGRCAIAVQNECAKIQIDSGNVEIINNLSNNVVVVYGADPKGVKQCQLLTKHTGWNYWNTEKHLYEQFGIEDPADYLNEGFSYKMLEKKLKQKGY